MDDLSRDRARRLSQAAFGQQHRLELMLAIVDSEDGIVTLTELSRKLDVTMSSLQRPMESLIETGLLTALPMSEFRYKHFMRNPSAAWQWAQELAVAAGVDLTDSVIPAQ
jgi:hypothetical protein